MTRERPAHRRASLLFDFESLGMRFTASVSRYPDSRIAELLLFPHHTPQTWRICK